MGIVRGHVLHLYVWYFASLGFFLGVVFRFFTWLKLLKSRKEYGISEVRRLRFDEMSFPTVVGFGGMLAGAGLSSFFLGSTGDPLSEFLLSIGDPPALRWLVSGLGALLGAGSAAGSLALARRARDRELLDAGADVADIGLTEEERRELLTE